jgi:hypothetical protein
VIREFIEYPTFSDWKRGIHNLVDWQSCPCLRSKATHPSHCLSMQINNLMMHEVVNTASEERVHLVVDVLEEAAPERVVLRPGQWCHYVSSASQANNPGC